jgi:hypothetical protein
MSSIKFAKDLKKGKKSELAAGASGLTQGIEKVG